MRTIIRGIQTKTLTGTKYFGDYFISYKKIRCFCHIQANWLKHTISTIKIVYFDFMKLICGSKFVKTKISKNFYFL